MEDAHGALPRLRSRLEDELSAVTSGRSSLSSPTFERVLPERQRDFRAAIPVPFPSPFLFLAVLSARSVQFPICSSEYRDVSFQPETGQSCDIIPIVARVSQREHHAARYANRVASIAIEHYDMSDG